MRILILIAEDVLQVIIDIRIALEVTVRMFKDYRL